MALFRKLFYRKPPDGLLEISERVYVFDCCFTADGMEKQDYKGYVGGVITQLKEHYPDASILVFNFREGETQSQMEIALSEYDMTIMEYPRHYDGCPLVPVKVIHHFLRSSESWLSLGLQNLLLMHCELGAWPVLAFMLAALLIYRKLYSGEQKTLDMVYKQAPREFLHLLSPLNPVPSQLRYLQYVSRRNVASEWPPLDRALTMECIIIRMIPDFDGEGGCRPIFRIYGQDPYLASDLAPKVLFSTPKKSKTVRHYKQAECEIVKIDINCHIQGDVVLECISLHDDLEREDMMFRVMFNTAFIRSNILMLNRDEIDIKWDARDLFPKDFRAEVLFSEMDTDASVVPVEFSSLEEKDGLPVEAFAKVQEIFSSVDWLGPKGDVAVEVLQQLTLSNAVIEALSPSEKSKGNEIHAALEYGAKTSTYISSGNEPDFSPKAVLDRKRTEPQYETGAIAAISFPEQASMLPGSHSLSSPTSSPSTAKTLYFSPTQHSGPNSQQDGMAKECSPLAEAETSSPITFPSSPETQPTKDSDVGPGRPMSLLAPHTPPLEDKSGFQSGVSPLRLHSPEMPSISSPPAQSPKSHDVVITDERPKPKPPLPPASSEDVVEATRIAIPGSPQSPSLTNSSTTLLSTLNAVEATGAGPPLLPTYHLSLPSTDGATVKYAPPPPHHHPNLFSTNINENSASVHGRTLPPAPSPPPISHSKEHSVCGVGPPSPPLPSLPSPSPFTASLNDNSDSRPESCPPPPPPLPSHPSTSPFAASLIDDSDSRPESCPPPVPPPPSSPLVHHNKSSSVRGGPRLPPPAPPPPPGSPLKEHSATSISPPPPITPPLQGKSVPRPTPLPPPPPPIPPKEGSIGGGSCVTLPPLYSEQKSGLVYPSNLAPPPPPPTPAKNFGPTTLMSSSVPSAPPPPIHSNGEASSLSNSVSPSGHRDISLSGSPSPPPPSIPPPPSVSPSGHRDISLSGSPSPPPPSIPPPGTKGKSVLSRTVTSRNNPTKKLKPLHWLKISRAVSGSMWAEAQKSGEASKTPEIDFSELESLFSAAVPNPGQGGSGRKTGSAASKGQKPEKVQLIEHRRAYNCEIMLSKVKIPLHDLLSSVLALEDSALDVDQVDNLIKFCPTREEMELLKGYKGEKDKLGKCELFFMELMQVPRIESKLRVFSFKIQFSSQVSDLRNNLNVVNSAADQIRGSSKLKRIMQTILSLGNALNHGTARGSAVGFRLDSLLKLTETRARNNKMTLMHYLCKVLSDKLPELLDFWQDLSSLEPASKIQLKFLAEEMQAINKGLEKVVQELSMSENDGPVSDQFRKALKDFLSFAEGEVRSLASLYSGVGRNVDALIIYFGEDPSRCPFEQVMSTLLNFVKMFKRAHEENCKQLEFERKKAEKEASDKPKIVMDAGHLLQSEAM